MGVVNNGATKQGLYSKEEVISMNKLYLLLSTIQRKKLGQSGVLLARFFANNVIKKAFYFGQEIKITVLLDIANGV